MNNFTDSSKWLILQYRPGAGGKFLCACLMTLDCVAHWDPRVERGDMSYQDWVRTQWIPSQQSKWIAFEPIHSWDNTFFSRTFPRGNNFNLNEFNQLVNQHSSDYFKEVWASDKLILDFLNKSTFPIWWEDANHVKLDATTHCSIHRQFLLNKIYPWDPVSGIGTVMMDKPLVENKYQNAKVFNNTYEFGPFDSEDQWYNYIWTNDFRLNFKINSPDILVTDLITWERLLKFINHLADTLNTKANLSDLKFVFEYWMDKNNLTLPK
jgi:hypothetical protein